MNKSSIFEKIYDYMSNGIALGNELYLTLAKYLFSGVIEKSPRNEEMAKKFIHSTEIITEGVLNYISKYKPNIICVNSGHIFFYGIIHKIATQNNIKVISYDETNIKVDELTWVFSMNRPVTDFFYDNQWKKYKTQQLTIEEENRIKKYFDKRTKYFLYELNQQYSHNEALNNFRNKFQKHFILFTNVLWDATIVGKDTIFKGLIEWVIDTIGYFNDHPELGLIIRVHPAEAGVYGMISKQRVREELSKNNCSLFDNIFFIDAEEKINSYDLIEHSIGVLVYASNIGFEALFREKNVICCGLNHYSNKGFMLEPKYIFRGSCLYWR